jgi:phage-related protein
MPQAQVYFYQEEEGDVPVRDWLADLQRKNRAAFAKCVEAIERLAQFGYELRRPHADMLREGIYELRVRQQRVNYRILYSFHGQNVAVLVHSLVKESAVPVMDVERALERKRKLEADPEKHTFVGESSDG